MNKQEVMEALLCADSNVPGNVITYVGMNLSDSDNQETIVFNHDEDLVWHACSIQEQDVKDFTNNLNEFMNSLPSGERQKSKAVEFVMRSGNQKWMTIVTIMGLQASQHEDSDESQLKSLLAKLIEKRLKRDSDDE